MADEGTPLKEASKPEPPSASPVGGDGAYPGKGFKLGEYVITSTLGHGAMATVFGATDATGHEVALKVFQEGPGVSKTMLERFRREAEASKKLRRHPNILTIYSTGKQGPYQYIVMEAIHNSQTFESAMESMPMSLKTVAEKVIRIARALQYAHTRNIVHRDVKPSNIMIDEFGEPLLSDFGVAELVDWPSCTVTGALTGTPLYMSPEQARAERVGPQSDIYSLGVVLFEAVTGVLPYSTQHAAPIKDVLVAVKEELPRRPRLYRKEVSPDLEAVMLKALEKNPNDRYVDAEAFASDLERALAGKPVGAHHFTHIDRLRHFSRQHERLLTTVLFVALAAMGVGLFFRNQLLQAHYDNLLSLAYRMNAYYSAQEAAPPAGSGDPSSWQETRQARQLMRRENWREAQRHFRAAADLANQLGEGRKAALANIDEARCTVMLGRFEEAKQTYLTVLKNPDAPITQAAIAHLEYLQLALLTGDTQGALDSLVVREPPADGPIRNAMNCLDGKLQPQRLVSTIESIPQRLRNDMYVTAAIRAHLDGQSKEASSYLRDADRASMTPSEWPAPLTQELKKTFRK